MNDTDRQRLMSEICQKWPNRFTDSDLGYWCRQLHFYKVDDVLSALTEWKASSKYAPKLPEIKARLARSGNVPSARKSSYLTAIAQGIASANPNLDGQPEAALILRYHRFWFFKYRKDLLLDKRTGTMREESETNRQLIREKHQIMLDACARDLWNGGCSEEEGKQLAAWFNAPQPEFDAALSQIPSQPQEIPEFA